MKCPRCLKSVRQLTDPGSPVFPGEERWSSEQICLECCDDVEDFDSSVEVDEDWDYWEEEDDNFYYWDDDKEDKAFF